MNLNAKVFATLLLLIGTLAFSACDQNGKKSGNETEKELPPPPDKDFANFEILFRQSELPLSIPYDYPPYGNSLADVIKENFLPREGNVFPADRFELKDGYRAFLTFEDVSGNFLLWMHVFNPENKVVDHHLVAGVDGNDFLEVEFRQGGSWTEVRRQKAEDTGLPTGDGIRTDWTIDRNGKIVPN